MLRQAFFFALVLGLSASASHGQSLQVSTNDGGSVVTPIYEKIKVNDGSSLRRTWLVINDPACPLQLSGSGIVTKWRGTDFGYIFYSAGSAKPSQPVKAFEVRYILYDTFGDHMETLSQTKVTDTDAGSVFNLADGEWHATGSEYSELLTVVVFVAQVRPSDGKIWRYDEKAVSGELAKIQVKAATGVLEPTKDKK